MIRTAAFAITSAIAIVVIAGNLPSYACSGQAPATTVGSQDAPLPSKTPARPSHDGARSSGGEPMVYEAEQLPYLPDRLEARLRSLFGNPLPDAGPTIPKS